MHVFNDESQNSTVKKIVKYLQIKEKLKYLKFYKFHNSYKNNFERIKL